MIYAAHGEEFNDVVEACGETGPINECIIW